MCLASFKSACVLFLVHRAVDNDTSDGSNADTERNGEERETSL
jgi:hypothetical protein